ncbi:MAG TPA: biopolymer transporter ExbD [Bryobacterales bacterium]|jgi:biopolymer transport protein ExbD|nr:biopolymer transporter ExbD [Bryobacterales bacterium]
MAFSPRNGRGSGALAEINVTPFVDVVLVLLIIFMLTAHVMEYGVEVDVPRTKQVANTSKELPVVNISSKGELYLNSEPVNINDLVKKLEPMLGKDRAAYLRCDKDVTWEIPVQVMAELGHAKVQVSVVTQPLEQLPRRK